MNYHVLTLFPEMIEQGVGTSITGRAIRNGILSLHTINIRDFSQDKRRRVDDYTYGGGAGMLMQAQPVFDAWCSVTEKLDPARKVRTIYVTPQGHTFTQHMAEEFAMSDELIFLCGHYEGIDERVLEEVVTDYVSIGDYVLTGGELAAMVMIDAISRMVPGVLHNDVSADTESFHGNLLEYPQYTRPEEWHGKKVPQELLTGDPKDVAKWRLEHSIRRTRERRPDLLLRYEAAAGCRRLLMTEKLSNMDLISQIDQGHYLILSKPAEDGCCILKNPLSGNCFFSDFAKGGLKADCAKAAEVLQKENWGAAYLRGESAAGIAEGLMAAGEVDGLQELRMYVLTRREKLPVTGLYRPDGRPTADGIVIKGEREFICYQNDKAVGSLALEQEGYAGLLVMADLSDKKAAKALLTCALNALLGMGKTPYLYLKEADPMEELATELGLYPAKTPVLKLTRSSRFGEKKQ